MRIHVDLSILKLLAHCLTIRFNSKKLWIPITYEKLPIICFCSGQITHNAKKCSLEIDQSQSTKVDKQFVHSYVLERIQGFLLHGKV